MGQQPLISDEQQRIGGDDVNGDEGMNSATTPPSILVPPATGAPTAAPAASTDGTMVWTVRKLLEWTTTFFAKKGVDEPLLAAQLLLAKVLGCRKMDLYLRFEQVVSEADRTAYRALVQRAGEHEPIAYIVGGREFYSLPLEVGPGVLIPRPETELLVQWVVRKARSDASFSTKSELRVLELGVGSGAIAISLATHLPKTTKITAVDVSAAAIDVAKRNCERHAVSDRVTLMRSDLYAAVDAAERFDFIVANLPYITERDYVALPKHIREYEPAEALVAGVDGLDVIRRAVADARRRLSAGGYIVLEIGYDQRSAMESMLSEAGLGAIEFEMDHGAIARVAIGKNTETQ